MGKPVTVGGSRLVVLATLCALGACGLGSGSEAPSSADAVELPEGTLAGVAWPEAGRLVVALDRDGTAIESAPELVGVDPEGGDAAPLDAGEDGCLRRAQTGPRTVGEARVVFSSLCSTDGGRTLTERYVMSLDLVTGETSRVVDELLRLGPGQIAWDDGSERGLYGEVGDPCVEMVALTREGAEPLAVEVRDGDRSWRIDGPSTESDCEALGNATWPAWSPDGAAIAFFASADAIGRSGTARLGASWDLYLMDADEMEPQRILEDVEDPASLTWDRSGDRVAFGGTLGGETGGWVFDVEDRSPTRFTDMELSHLDWGPDGNEIAGVSADRLFVFDVP